MRHRTLALLATSALSLICGEGASAADLAPRPVYKAPPPVVAAPYSWSGWYVGAHLGGGWARKEWGDTSPSCLGIFGSVSTVGCTPDLGSHTASGLLGGGQVGVNWQSDSWIFGIEGQFSFSRLDGHHSRTNSLTSADGLSTFTGTERFSTRVRDLGTIAGRLGITVGATGNTLLFAKGGAAFADDRFALAITGVGSCPRAPVCSFPIASSASLADTQFRWGWMAGAGIEYMFSPSWSVKVEYDFLGLRKENVTLVGTSCSTSAGGLQTCSSGSRTLAIEQDVQLVKVGINYHFGEAPLRARY